MTTWRERMEARFGELNERVNEERASLSEWRKGEAVNLALTYEEADERNELSRILDLLEAEDERRGSR